MGSRNIQFHRVFLISIFRSPCVSYFVCTVVLGCKLFSALSALSVILCCHQYGVFVHFVVSMRCLFMLSSVLAVKIFRMRYLLKLLPAYDVWSSYSWYWVFVQMQLAWDVCSYCDLLKYGFLCGMSIQLSV